MSNLTNNTLIRQEETDTYIHGIITGVLVPTGILGSLLCLYFIKQRHFEQTPQSDALLINLCVSSLLFCTVNAPVLAYTLTTFPINYFFLHPSACQGLVYIFWFSQTASAYAHVGIALNRFITLMFLSHKKFSYSNLVAGFLIAAGWIIPLVTFIFPLFHMFGTFGYTTIAHTCLFVGVILRPYQLTYKTLNSFFPLSLMVVSYLAISVKLYCIAINRQRRIDKSVNNDAFSRTTGGLTRATDATVAKRKRVRAEIRTTNTAMITCFIFLICYVPNSLYGFFVKTVRDLQSTTGMSLILLVWIGCATSPVFYVAMSSVLRRKLIPIFRTGGSRSDRMESIRQQTQPSIEND
ncbi:protein trapped in endoderm-1-like [Paramacrobiotus metropolitanus]|uniref:protein trapped in endoderm-1-like n=1 Tax=Paramacrobiotus metropolitanus TaxID=2943436 RepID=UPI0024460C41|nr:protein trapped in endoderm-1-like [Paramacrobiotus metropolitanus]